MTIKTELLLLERESNISRRSDNTTVAMQKRGAVRNLFGPPDRQELKLQVEQQDDENSKKLDGFRYSGLIGVLLNPPDHAKRLKRQSSVQSESDDDDDSPSSPFKPTHNSFQRNLCTGEASSSVAVPPAPLSPSSSSSTDAPELPSNANGSPRNAPRRRGQQTITSYFHVIKRGRMDRRDKRSK